MCTELRIIELVAARYGPCEIGDLQDRMKRAVALLGPEEVKNIMREEGKIEVILQGLHSNSSAGSPKPALPWSAGAPRRCMPKSCNACSVCFWV